MGTIEDGILVKVCQKCYLQYPRNTGPCYRANTVLRIPTALANRLAHPKDNSRPTVVIVNENPNDGGSDK